MEKLTDVYTLTTGKYNKLLKETRCIHEISKASIKVNKYYTTVDTKDILALMYDLKLTQIVNSSISHNAACQNSIRIFLCL